MDFDKNILKDTILASKFPNSFNYIFDQYEIFKNSTIPNNIIALYNIKEDIEKNCRIYENEINKFFLYIFDDLNSKDINKTLNIISAFSSNIIDINSEYLILNALEKILYNGENYNHFQKIEFCYRLMTNIEIPTVFLSNYIYNFLCEFVNEYLRNNDFKKVEIKFGKIIALPKLNKHYLNTNIKNIDKILKSLVVQSDFEFRKINTVRRRHIRRVRNSRKFR